MVHPSMCCDLPCGPPTHRRALERELTDDTIWLLLETMPFKEMGSFLQTQYGLVQFYRVDNNYAHFLSIAKNRFTPDLFSRLNKDARKDKDGTIPACLALIKRASFYKTHLQDIDADTREFILDGKTRLRLDPSKTWATNNPTCLCHNACVTTFCCVCGWI